MLAEVLSGSEAARLRRTLMREERLASSAGASYYGIARGPGFFYLSATPTPGKGVAEVEQALRREMKKIIDDGVTADELERVKAQAVASHVYQRDSMFFQARQIGVMELSGIPHGTIDLQLAKLRAVTPEQVREVARKYFQDDALTIATLDPQPMSGRRPAPRPEGLRHARRGGDAGAFDSPDPALADRGRGARLLRREPRSADAGYQRRVSGRVGVRPGGQGGGGEHGRTHAGPGRGRHKRG
jgi:hypothetical protein